ncbi:MAG TPA: TIM barrel protein [Steroidobacteraceae bacterium]|nr:TIM barrel protein [Steroidobacteraceae bacterium]
MLGLSANISLLFREMPLLARFAAARAAGFPTVEIQVPYEHSAAALTNAARAAQVQVVLINAPLGEDPRTFGTASLPGRGAQLRAELQRAAEYAQALGTGCVNVLAGRCDPQDQPAALQRLTDNLALAAEILATVDARPLLEVINPVNGPGYCVPDFESAARILEATDARVGLQFDVYHAAMLGLDPAQTFTRHLARIRHVQFADHPGRGEPGSGSLDFAGIFRTIRDSSYSGWVGAEYHPVGATPASLGWMRQYFQ